MIVTLLLSWLILRFVYSNNFFLVVIKLLLLMLESTTLVCKHLPRIAVKSYNEVSWTNETTLTRINNFQSAAFSVITLVIEWLHWLIINWGILAAVCQTETAIWWRSWIFHFTSFCFGNINVLAWQVKAGACCVQFTVSQWLGQIRCL